MIYIILTSYGEPELTVKAIKSFLKQEIEDTHKIIVVDPFKETEEVLKKEFKKGKNIEFFLDPGVGKSYALNNVLEKIYSQNKKEIIILSDGDVYVSEKAVGEILNTFKDEKVGCLTGRPVSLDSRNKKFGYWSHLLFEGIHKARKKLSNENKFFECSGYLFAIRNGVLQGFPIEASEDSIIPYLFWKKGYKIKYIPKAEVYVLNNYNWKNWLSQKIRNIKGHENLNNLAPGMPRTKSFFNEIKHGWYFLFSYPKGIRELVWTFELYFARLYIYFMAFYDIKFKKKKYSDGWRGEK